MSRVASRRRGRMFPLWCHVLAALLAVGPALAAGPQPPQPREPVCALTVGSEPGGATVYVDGALSGTTPVRLDSLEPATIACAWSRKAISRTAASSCCGAGNWALSTFA